MGKRSDDAAKGFDREAVYSTDEALELTKAMATAKFDETIDVTLRLGVDPRKAEEMLRGTVALPSGSGREVRVAVFAQGEAATAAREAGADHVGDSDLAEAIEGGMTDFDLAIATPDMMPVVGKLGKILGPRGLMPNPKLGTVTNDVAQAIQAAKGGQVEFRAEKAGIVHAGIGKASFTEQALAENIRAFVKAINGAKPSGAKGTYLKRVSVSSTMGPGVKLEVATLTAPV